MAFTKLIPARKFRNWKVLVITSPRRLHPGRFPSSRWIAMSDSRSAITRLLRSAYLPKKIASLRLCRAKSGTLAIATFTLAALSTSGAQTQAGPRPDNYWRKFAMGVASSILANESAHLLTAIAVGAHPYVGFDKGRPTVFSGIDSEKDPHKQFLFSAAGLTTQALINEVILDIPHSRGGAFERGVLAGGIATSFFYITLGRNASVSDI